VLVGLGGTTGGTYGHVQKRLEKLGRTAENEGLQCRSRARGRLSEYYAKAIQGRSARDVSVVLSVSQSYD